MSFIRTVTYTFPYERINDFNVGTDLQMRLVAAHKLICQESSGMLDTGVWLTQLSDGKLRAVSFTKWYSVEDLQAFADDPDVRHHEGVITTATTDGNREVEIYEVIG
jgi:hypothetical protein